MKNFFVYIMASKPYGVLYVGITSDLIKRVWQHKEGAVDGFTKKYQIKNLIYYETHESTESAILREKRIKKWNRSMKIDLIERQNPLWEDLYKSLFPDPLLDKIPAYAGMTYEVGQA
ncbi:MAG: GIY-YIG nuclease family protein [Rickettsiales bacterium]